LYHTQDDNSKLAIGQMHVHIFLECKCRGYISTCIVTWFIFV